MTESSNNIFVRACRRQDTERTPIWIMRQAGRYLPEYRAVREKYDFLTMCKTPELASEVTIQPIDRFGLDAAIIFSDILVIPEAMGMRLEMVESKGPVFEKPIQGIEDIDKLELKDIDERLSFVYDAVKLTKERLQNRVPLIGFSGAPWTLAAYMVEGSGNKSFDKAKSFIRNCPSAAHSLLQKLSAAVSCYLREKIECGCDVVQIFDTWAGILTAEEYDEFSLKYIKQIVDNIKSAGAPIIVFAKGIDSYSKLAALDCDVIGVDWTADLGAVRKQIDGRKALQGNLNPAIMLSSPEEIKTHAGSVLESYGCSNGHIFNLGHGILPNTPVENVKALVDYIKSKSKAYH